MGLRVSHNRDATPGLLVPSVKSDQWHSPQSHASFKGIGLKVFEGFVSVHVFEYESMAQQKLELASLKSIHQSPETCCNPLLQELETFLSAFNMEKTVPK